MLHITNGDNATELITQCGVSGDVLPWRDVLHEGPVPAGLELDALSPVRARFIAATGWATDNEVLREFEQRDARLRQVGRDEDVVLWFEADLYDQLQLLQLLDWFHQYPPRSLSLICIGEHPTVPRFAGLGQLTPEQMADLFPIRRSVTPAQLELGREAWAAFTAPSPLPLVNFLKQDTTALPFLTSALVRLLEEYPSVEEGAGRTEHQVLIAVSQGADSFNAVFTATQAMEARIFMGDTVLMTRIGDLRREPGPALSVDRMELTALGQAYLAKTADLVREHGIERWIGGVHLSGPRVPWRWERRENLLISQ